MPSQVRSRYQNRPSRYLPETSHSHVLAYGNVCDVFISEKGTTCTTEIKWYSSDNGVLELTNIDTDVVARTGENITEAKAFSRQSATTRGKEMTSRTNAINRKFDAVYPENCAGGRGSLIPAEIPNAEAQARQISNMAVFEEGNPDPICQGGTVHYVINYAKYQLGKTECQ